MRFKALNDSELMNLLPEGEYDFVVKDAQDTLSKAGNEMIKLKLCVSDNRIIFDYLLEAMSHKLKHFAQAVGLDDKYNAGGFEAADCIDRRGRCLIVKEEGIGNFGPKNSVRDYCKANPVNVKQEDFTDDQIPF